VGRVLVGPDLAAPGHPELFVVGDLAAVPGADGRPVPGVAQAALQMGRHAGRIIAREVVRAAGDPAPHRPVFRYRDRGTMAVIGKASAVAAIGRLHVGGFFAWLVWSVIHILWLVGFRNRLQVALSWFWNWLIDARDARLITVPARLDVEKPLAGRFVADEPSNAPQ
jgi:NADH dehydrogenase